jgi:zinc protease
MKRANYKLNALKLAVAVIPLIGASISHAMDVSFEEDHSLPIVQVSLAVKAGSVTDPAGQAGITNFMGEMLLRGTRSKSKEQIDLALDQMGARLAVETRAESMIFRGAVLASQLPKFLALMSEIVTQPSFPEAEIRKLKAENVSELLEELGEDSALESRNFQEFLFEGHPYGKPVNGRIKDVEAFNRAKAMGQYTHYVHDKNLLVVGSGDTTQETIQKWADELAAKLPSANKPVVSAVNAPKNAEHRRMMIVDKPDRTQTQMSAGQIGVKMTDSDFFPLYVGNFILGGPTFSSRLMEEIRVKRGWSYGANSGFRFGQEPRYWRAHLFPASKDAAPALAETLHLIDQMKTAGVTGTEFSFAQTSIVNKSGFMYNTPAKRVENALLEKTLNLPTGFMKSYGPEVAKVTRDQVNKAMGSFLKPDKMAITVVGTASELKEPLAKAAGIPVDQVVVKPYAEE